MASSSKRVHPNRHVERDAVNAVRTFFEHNDVIFFEIDLRADFGKDAVIELVDGDQPTGQWVGLQIKGGKQTTRTRKGVEVHGIPFTAKDARHLRNANIPVLGIMPANPGESSELLWVNLSQLCTDRFKEKGEDQGGFAEVMERLSSYRLTAFLEQMRKLAGGRLETAALDLVSEEVETQQSGVIDCFVLARSDPRALVLVRRLLLSFGHAAMGTAIEALVHVIGHGDIFWHPRNTLPSNSQVQIKRSFRWTHEEISALLEFLPQESEEQMWGRGTFGQHICALLSADPSSAIDLILIAENRRRYPLLVRQRAYILAVYLAGDNAREVSSRIVRYSHDLVDDEYMREIVGMVQAEGWLSIY